MYDRADVLASMPHGADRTQVAGLFGLRPEDILDFSSNIFSQGFSPRMHELAYHSLGQVGHYPDPYAETLRSELAWRRNLSPKQILLGNGGADLIFRLAAFLRTDPNFPLRSEVIVTGPGFSEYKKALEAFGLNVQEHILSPDQDFKLDASILESINRNTLAIWLCQPNNPTGQVIEPEVLNQIRQACDQADIYLMQDECFLEFLPIENQARYSLRSGFQPKEIILKSFTKLYGMPGLRLGWLEAANPAIISRLQDLSPSWQVSRPAIAAGHGALAIPQDQIDEWQRAIAQERERIMLALEDFGAQGIMGRANFVFFYSEYPNLQEALLLNRQRPILIRNCSNYAGLGPGYYRVAVLEPKENNALIAALKKLGLEAIGDKLGLEPVLPIEAEDPEPVRAKTSLEVRRIKLPAFNRLKGKGPLSIMLLGTSSNVGKSVLSVGLCRLFARHGFKVMPFKSQNMSEYHEMEDGKRYSTAQLQMAEAAQVDYLPEMNPVLLCPRSERGSDVYLLGEYWKSPSAGEYYKLKAGLWPGVEAAYRTLQEKADIIVIEGAGSPAEINLQKDDFVNLGLASRLDIPCLLIGDIDRGGVFAALYGTQALTGQLGEDHIKGYIINKFRGDEKILEPGLKQFESIARKPILGTVPMQKGLKLEREDSLSDDYATYTPEEREMAYEQLADALESSLDLDQLTKIMLREI